MNTCMPAQVLNHIEAEIFGAGRGNYDRCHLLLAGLLERPAMQRLLNKKTEEMARGITAMHLSLQKARDTLGRTPPPNQLQFSLLLATCLCFFTLVKR